MEGTNIRTLKLNASNLHNMATKTVSNIPNLHTLHAQSGSASYEPSNSNSNSNSDSRNKKYPPIPNNLSSSFHDDDNKEYSITSKSKTHSHYYPHDRHNHSLSSSQIQQNNRSNFNQNMKNPKASEPPKLTSVHEGKLAQQRRSLQWKRTVMLAGHGQKGNSKDSAGAFGYKGPGSPANGPIFEQMRMMMMMTRI